MCEFFYVDANLRRVMQCCLPNDSRTVHPVLRQLHTENAVVTEIQGLMLPEESEYLRRHAETQGFEASTVVGEKGENSTDNRRTSRTSFLPKGKDPVINCIGERIATIAGHPMSHMEPMQVTDYKHKQEYKAHHDYFGKKGEPDRTMTVFAYLHSEECEEGKCGGATAFYNLKQADGEPLRVFPKPGNAVMWSNRTLKGELNPMTLHSGEKLTCTGAHKVGLNAWFRDTEW